MAIKIKLDLSKLTEEFTYESKEITNQGDIDSEIGYSELVDVIMSKITVVEDKYIKSKDNNNKEVNNNMTQKEFEEI